MIAEYKYKIGKKAYVIKRSYSEVSEPCGYCEGTGGMLTPSGTQRRCNVCCGEGITISHTDSMPFVQKVRITSVNLNINVKDEGGTTIIYDYAVMEIPELSYKPQKGVDYPSGSDYEDELFPTKKLALDRCKELKAAMRDD